MCNNGFVFHSSGVGPVVVSSLRHIAHLWLVDATRAVADVGLVVPGGPAFSDQEASWILHGSLTAALAALKLYVWGQGCVWGGMMG